MAKKKRSDEDRAARQRATKELTTLVRLNTGMSAAALEEETWMSGSVFNRACPGMRWRRYESGARCMSMPELDRLARFALLKGWVALDSSTMNHRAFFGMGTLRALFRQVHAGAPLTSQLIEQDQVRWLAWYEARKSAQAKAAARVKVLSKAMIALSDEFLSELDRAVAPGGGYDFWSVAAVDQEVVVDEYGNTEVLSTDHQFRNEIQHLKKLVSSVKLESMHELAADWTPEPDTHPA